MNSSKTVTALIAATVLIAGCTQVESEKPGDEAHITEVVDGDTLEAEIRNRTVTLRLQGVDTPEVHTSNNVSEWECSMTQQHLREHGEKASQFVKENYDDKEVRVVYRGEGYYGRTLASVYLNGTNLEKQLLRKGLAQTYESSSFEEKQRFLQIESKTRRKEKGVWSVC